MRLASGFSRSLKCQSMAVARASTPKRLASTSNSSNLSNVWFKVTNLNVVTGSGCWVTTTNGDKYLDFASGIAVNSTGHSQYPIFLLIAEGQ